MPNQPASDTVTVSFTLPRALNQQVEKLAIREMTNKSDIIRRALLQYLPAEEAARIVALVSEEAGKAHVGPKRTS